MNDAAAVGEGVGSGTRNIFAPDPKPGSDPARERLLDSLMPFSRALVAISVRSLGEAQVELTLPQYRIMVVLASRGPQRTVDLAVEQRVLPSTITRACDRLIRRGLVCRYRNPADRRVAWLALTERGRDLVGEVMRYRRAEFEKLIALAGIADTAAVAGVIEALARAAGEPPEAEWWRNWSRSVVPDTQREQVLIDPESSCPRD